MIVEIRKGGKLSKLVWDKKKRKEVGKDITDEAFAHLFSECRFQEGLKFKDILLLLNRHLTVFSVTLNNWTSELVAEGLKKSKAKIKKRASDIEWLELRAWGSVYPPHDKKGKPELEGLAFPQFSGIGYKQKKNKYTHGWLSVKKGQRETYAIEMTPVNELADLPIKLDRQFDITSYEKKVKVLGSYNVDFTLGQVLYGIVWELSFFGSPTDRDAKLKELNQRLDDIKSGKAKTIPWKDVKKNIKKRLKKAKAAAVKA